MKVSWHILNKFVQPEKAVTPYEISNTLTMSTVEVDDVIDQAKLLAGVVVGLVLEVKQHPKADKLKLAVVDIGSEKVKIVCGGVNLRQHMKVALAKVGARVKWHGQGDWINLEEATIRGEKSGGMACAADELGLADSQAVEGGIMDLSHFEVKPGTSLAEVLGMDDVILDIDNKSLTHRPDLWGHFGLARELAAVWGTNLRTLEPKRIEQKKEVELEVKIKTPKQAWRYLGVVVDNIVVKPSPLWLQQALTALGLRPINNIVDVTNYIMCELGQPMHAFDMSKLNNPSIVVRLAKKGEKLLALDNKEYELTESDLVIADKKKPQAIAGVIGGMFSQVTKETKTIIVESACFEPVGVRKTATRLNLRTDASVRFEKGLDPEMAILAIRRAVELLAEVAPGSKVVSNLVDEYPTKIKPQPISFTLNWLDSRLGFEISVERVQDILTKLGFTVDVKGNNFKVTPPTWRATGDITIPEDVVEEVARIYGYDSVPLSLPKFTIEPPLTHPHKGLRKILQMLMPSLGFNETINYSFVSESDLKIAGVNPANAMELVNPVDQTNSWLRPSLVSGLFRHLAKNVNNFDEVKLFEIGRIFVKENSRWLVGAAGEVTLPNQPYQLAMVVNGTLADQNKAFRQVVGAVDALLGFLNLQCDKYKLDVLPKFIAKNRGASLQIGKLVIGYVGEVSHDIITQYGVPENSAVAIINLDDLPTDIINKKVKDIPLYPAIRRDLSIIVPNYLTWSEIEKVVKESAKLLESIELFDVYEKPALGEDKRSLAFSMVFRSSEKTLKSEEVEKELSKICQELTNKFVITIRS